MKKAWSWAKNKFREWFSLDYRSLALLRIGFGITIILDLIGRSHDLVAFYSDQGVLSRASLLTLWSDQSWISIHLISGLAGVQAILFIIAAIFAVMLIVGYRTTLAMIMSWFLLVSLQIRDPIILQGGDVLFRVMAFWMMFLPLNRVWSLDRLFNRVPRPKTKTVFSVAAFAYIAQICIFYVFTGLLKSGAAWQNGTAVYYALNVDQLVTPIGVMLRGFPHLMTLLTYSVHYFEIFGTLLFFSPIATGPVRMLGLVLYTLMQVGFNSSMRLGLFGIITVVIMFGLIPSGFWDNNFRKWSAWLSSKGKKGLFIYYDFDCTFCAKVSFLIQRLLALHPETRVMPATTDPAIEKIMLEKNSWVIIDRKGITHFGWDGVVTVIGYSPYLFWFRPILQWHPIETLGEMAYREIAQRRKNVCVPEIEEPAPTPLKKTWLAIVSIVVAILIVYTFTWNLDTLGGKAITPKNLSWIVWATHLDQNWNMFAPTPLTEDGWYVFPGTLRDGTSVDVFDGASPVSYAEPKWIAYTYKNQRWQKFMMNLWSKDFTSYRLGYGQYLCRQWNNSHPYDKQLMTFNMVFMLKNTPAPGQPQGPIVPTTIWEHHCF